jgi:hypothetical protein
MVPTVQGQTNKMGTLGKRISIVYRNTDLMVVALHFKELDAEAARNRLMVQSGLWEDHRISSWAIQWLNGTWNWIAGWRCTLQSQFSHSLFPGLRRLVADQDPCLCSPQLCIE